MSLGSVPASVTDHSSNPDMKPYIITPYIVPTSRSGSPAPNARSYSLDSELEVAVLPYDAAFSSYRRSTAHMDDLDPWSEVVMYEKEEYECTKSLGVADTSRVPSPTPSDTLHQIISPIALEPTRLSGEYSRRSSRMRTGNISLATVGLTSVGDGLKEKTKRRRKSKIQSVPRPRSFYIDKSRTGHSPTEGPLPLPSWLPSPPINDS